MHIYTETDLLRGTTSRSDRLRLAVCSARPRCHPPSGRGAVAKVQPMARCSGNGRSSEASHGTDPLDAANHGIVA